jgi:hypothetical protein
MSTNRFIEYHIPMELQNTKGSWVWGDRSMDRDGVGLRKVVAYQKKKIRIGIINLRC